MFGRRIVDPNLKNPMPNLKVRFEPEISEPVDMYIVCLRPRRTVHCTSDGLSLDSDRVRRTSRLVFVYGVDSLHVLSMYCFFYIFD